MFVRLAPWVVGVLWVFTVIMAFLLMTPWQLGCAVIVSIAFGSTIATAYLSRSRR